MGIFFIGGWQARLSLLLLLAALPSLFAIEPGKPIHCPLQSLGNRPVENRFYELSTERRKGLAREYQEFVDHWRKESAPSLVARLQRHLNSVDFNRLRSFLSDNKNQLVTRADLAVLCGYLDFLRSEGISIDKFPLEIRVEKNGSGGKAYFLTDIEHSLVGNPLGKAIAWTHDDEWARERFLKNHSGNYLLGQTLGTSKFVTLGTFPPNLTKKEMLQKLGLVGYAKFDKPGPFYLVSVDVTKKRLSQLKPKVPVLYKWTNDSGDFEMASHFDEDSIPGFTSGGLSEVVIPTFTAKAKDLADLAKNGIRLQVHSDDP